MPIPLVKVPGSRRRKRVGRGISAGQGKTAGRGTKGQKSRSGDKQRPRFEGGRMPIIRQLPKMDGFVHHRKIVYHPINLEDLEKLPIEVKEVNLEVLKNYRLLSKKNLPVKILGNGEISRPLKVFAHAFSKTAREKIEKAGGACEVIEE